MAYNPGYPGMPGVPPHQHHHGHVPPHVPGPAGHHKEVDYVSVKSRYRDKNMDSTFKVHIFASDRVLGNLHSEVSQLCPRADLKRNNESHCLTLTRLGKENHSLEIHLFSVLSRRGFALKSSHTNTVAVSDENDIITTYLFARG